MFVASCTQRHAVFRTRHTPSPLAIKNGFKKWLDRGSRYQREALRSLTLKTFLFPHCRGPVFSPAGLRSKHLLDFGLTGLRHVHVEAMTGRDSRGGHSYMSEEQTTVKQLYPEAKFTMKLYARMGVS